MEGLKAVSQELKTGARGGDPVRCIQQLQQSENLCGGQIPKMPHTIHPPVMWSKSNALYLFSLWL